MVYIFNYCESEGYVCRVPLAMAKLICMVGAWFGKTWDYGNSPLEEV